MSIPEHRWSRTCDLPCKQHWPHPASLRRPRDSADRRRSSARRGLQGLREHCWTSTLKPQIPCDRPVTLVVPSAPALAPFSHQLPTRSDRHQASAEPQSSDPLAGSAIHPVLKGTFYFSNLSHSFDRKPDLSYWVSRWLQWQQCRMLTAPSGNASSSMMVAREFP